MAQGCSPLRTSCRHLVALAPLLLLPAAQIQGAMQPAPAAGPPLGRPAPRPAAQPQPASSPAAAGAEFPGHLKVIKQLGRGAYGTVHLCEDTRTGTQVAVKHVRHAVRHGKSILREVRLLARLWHENLLHILDFPAVSSPNFEDVLLVLPYMPADLHKVIQSQQALTEKHVQVIMVQILRAMAHLHAAGVAHRDLKPANILLTSDCKLKVCDFGLARGDMGNGDGDEPDQAGVLTEYVVTRWYRAPEVMLLPKQYTASVDLWSIGCILAEILGRRAIFPGKNHIDMVCRVSQVIGSPSDEELGWLPKNSDAYRFLRKVCPQSAGVPLSTLYPRASPACLDLVKALLSWDPSKRVTASGAQEHEYLRAYLPKEAPVPPEPFDWSFDNYKASTDTVRERLYRECARFHPQILERDRAQRAPWGSGVGESAASARGYPPAPPARQVVAPPHAPKPLGKSPGTNRSPSQSRLGAATPPAPAAAAPAAAAPAAAPPATSLAAAPAAAPRAVTPVRRAVRAPGAACASTEAVAAPVRSLTPRRGIPCGLVRAAG